MDLEVESEASIGCRARGRDIEINVYSPDHVIIHAIDHDSVTP